MERQSHQCAWKCPRCSYVLTELERYKQETFSRTRAVSRGQLVADVWNDYVGGKVDQAFDMRWLDDETRRLFFEEERREPTLWDGGPLLP